MIQLNQNKTDLQSILDAVNALPEAGYDKDEVDAATEDIATAIESKGVEVPDGATLDEMAALVDLVKTGVIEVSTSAGMYAVLTEDNVGKAYKFTGTTDDTYTSGDIYVVEVSS